MLFPILGPSSQPVAVAQSDEIQANITVSVLEWYDRHRAIRAYNIWFKRRSTQNNKNEKQSKVKEYNLACMTSTDVMSITNNY